MQSSVFMKRWKEGENHLLYRDAKKPWFLPNVLSEAEISSILLKTENPKHKVILATIYSDLS